MSERKPRAFMRRWHFDGIKPAKEKKANGRWAWPTKFQFLPITEGRVFEDDVPLYADEDEA